jgi:uncharacterized protein (DUF1810 family)
LRCTVPRYTWIQLCTLSYNTKDLKAKKCLVEGINQLRLYVAGLLYLIVMSDLQRFIDAQETDYPIALGEIKNGRKRSHWMWYIFPQIQGLGHSDTAKLYAIKNIDEAEDYMNDPVLGQRLIEICTALLQLETSDAYQIFGSPDDLKLKSSMTLFASLPDAYPVFQSVLEKYSFKPINFYVILFLLK